VSNNKTNKYARVLEEFFHYRDLLFETIKFILSN
jgi:hypothetical protein